MTRLEGELLDKETKYEEAYEKYKVALNFASSKEDSAILYQRIGFNRDGVSQLHEALDVLKKAIALFNSASGDQTINIATVQNLLSIVYAKQGDNRNAINYGVQSYQIFNKLYGDRDPRVLSIRNNLGVFYLLVKEYENAIPIFQKIAELYYDENGEATSVDDNLPNAENNLGLCYAELGKYEEAHTHYNRALKYSLQLFGEMHPLTAGIYGGIAEVLIGQSKLDEAEIATNRSMDIYRNTVGEGFYTGYTHNNLAVIDNQRGHYNKSLKNYDLALEKYGYDFDDVHSLDQVNWYIYLLETIKSRGEMCIKAASETKVPAFTHYAQQSFEKGIEIIDYLKSNYKEAESVEAMLEFNYSLYEGLIQIHYNQFEESQEEKHIVKALESFEKSKTNLLMLELQQSEALQKAGITQDQQTKLVELKKKIANFELTQKESPSDSLTAAIGETRNEYNELISKLEKEYPRYFELTRDDVTLNPNFVEQITDDYDVLSFFIGEQDFYCIKLSSKGNEFKKLGESATLDKKLKSLLDDIYNHPSNTSEGNWKKIAEELAQVLIEPFEIDPYKKLLIIPDGNLHFLPFDILQYKEKNLLSSYPIAYTLSLNLLEKISSREYEHKESLAAFAPKFEDPANEVNDYVALRNELGPLKWNEKEANEISELYRGRSYIAKDASLENFIKEVEKVSILHLATHSKVNVNNKFSFIALNDTLGQIEKLYLKDIYNMKLKNDMVVLSSCETGLGDYNKGDGVNSLARGYMRAGSKAVISSLWSVNDQVSAEIMKNFYEQLKKSKTKDEALRNAKLQYLDNADPQYKHPFYWASLTAIGDMETLLPKSPLDALTLPIAALIIIWLLMMSFGTKKNEKGQDKIDLTKR